MRGWVMRRWEVMQFACWCFALVGFEAQWGAWQQLEGDWDPFEGGRQCGLLCYVMLAVNGAVEGKMWEDDGGNDEGKGKEGCEAKKGRRQI